MSGRLMCLSGSGRAGVRRAALTMAVALGALLVLGGAPAWALKASTGSATGVTQFTATLHAAIDPGEAPAGYHFAYGTTGEYGSVIPLPDLYLLRGAGETPVAATVVGLQPGTTYHFAIVASGPEGVVTGTDETFTTLSIPPPDVSTGAVEDITRGEATLTGSVEPLGWNSTYSFEYGTSTAYGASWPSVPASMGGLSGAQPAVAAVSNLLPATLYHYRLVASNPGGTSYGPDRTFTTESYPVSAVQEPAILSTRLGIVTPAGASGEASKPKGGKQGRKKSKGKQRKGEKKGGGKR
jgi:hypothetical protein